jgi:hypothetical protein
MEEREKWGSYFMQYMDSKKVSSIFSISGNVSFEIYKILNGFSIDFYGRI